MRHPTEGVLRRLLDEPAGVADADRAHVTACPHCAAGLEDARADAAAAGAALDAANLRSVDVDAAWARLSVTPPAAVRGRRRATARSGWWRPALRRPAVAVLGAVVVLTGAGVAAATDWLPIFHTEQVAAVPVNTAELNQLPDLSAYGDLEVSKHGAPEKVADAAAAHERTGLDVPRVTDLPRGVTGDPVYAVGNQISATFTFSVAKAVQAASATGQAVPQAPPGLDGSKVRLQAGPGVAEVWSHAQGVPTLVVARLVAPTADSSGVSFTTVRDYLLSLPGLPDSLAAQLRAFPAAASTLPLPVPADMVTTSSADVAGSPATVLTSRDGSMAAVVWVKDGVLTGVGGSLSADEVLAVARGLR